jgi:DNA-binding MarR family transcriptional regulator
MTNTHDSIGGQRSHLASALLAVRTFSNVATDALTSQVGAGYTDNSSIACLCAIVEGGPIRLRDLTATVGLSGPTASRVVDRLVASGDVVRSPGPDGGDGRAVEMAATERGVERVGQINRALIADAGAVSAPVKEAIAHLEFTEPAGAPTIATEASVAAALARVGLDLGAALRTISASGDVTEVLALFVFADDPVQRPTLIADRVGLSSGGTTKLLDRLEQQGLIEREFGLTEDRRGVSLRLTELGAEQLRRSLDLALPLVPSLLVVLEALAAQLTGKP